MSRKRNSFFTVGESNKIIDAILHPMAEQDMRYWAVDWFFHAIVEQNPRQSAEKFLKYTLPKILDQYTKEARRRQRGMH